MLAQLVSVALTASVKTTDSFLLSVALTASVKATDSKSVSSFNHFQSEMATYRNTFQNMTEGGQQLSVSDEIVASQETRNVEVSRKLFSLQSTVFYHFYPIKLKWGPVFNKYHYSCALIN